MSDAPAFAVFALSILIVYVASFVTFELLSVATITYVYVSAGVLAAIVIVVPFILILFVSFCAEFFSVFSVYV